MAVNVGDMLQRLTNNRLPSTTHRVRNPDEGRASVARYSMPFFLHFRSDYPIETLENCVDASHQISTRHRSPPTTICRSGYARSGSRSRADNIDAAAMPPRGDQHLMDNTVLVMGAH
jgi:isopenicillin N synthase-like dioxygenase